MGVRKLEEEVEKMTPEEVARKLKMGVEGVRAAIRQGKFPFRNSISRKNWTMELHNNKEKIL